MPRETPVPALNRSDWKTAAALYLNRVRNWPPLRRTDAGFRVATVAGSLGLLLALLLFLNGRTGAALPPAHIAPRQLPAIESLAAVPPQSDEVVVEDLLDQPDPRPGSVFPLQIEVADADEPRDASPPQLTFDPVEPAEDEFDFSDEPQLAAAPPARPSLSFRDDERGFPRLGFEPDEAPVRQVAGTPEPPASVELQVPVDDEFEEPEAGEMAEPADTAPDPDAFAQPADRPGWRLQGRTAQPGEFADPLSDEAPVTTPRQTPVPAIAQVPPSDGDDEEDFAPPANPGARIPAVPIVEEETDEDTLVPRKSGNGWRKLDPGAPGEATREVPPAAETGVPPETSQPDNVPAAEAFDEPEFEPEEPASTPDFDTDEEPRTVTPPERAAPVDPFPAARPQPPATPPAAAAVQLELVMSAPASAAVNQLVPVEFQIVNRGQVAAENVVLYVSLPEPFLHHAGRQIEYRAGRIEPGQTHPARMRILAVAPGQATAEAELVSGSIVWPRRTAVVNLHPASAQAPSAPRPDCNACTLPPAPVGWSWWICP